MVYLLKYDIPELTDISDDMFGRLVGMVDSHRATETKRVKNNKARAAALGAGLLLQYAMSEWLSGVRDNSYVEINAESPLSLLGPINDFEFTIGDQGKPYFKDKDLPYFNISHAGSYVAIAISDKEVGIDIQDKRKQKEKDLAKRFYSKREHASVKADSTGDMFYRLWTRKEALGKCTGDGVRPYLDTDVLELNKGELAKYEWNEKRVYDCFLCVCKRK
jgi:4'-phosphopantetheinyl transferase